MYIENRKIEFLAITDLHIVWTYFVELLTIQATLVMRRSADKAIRVQIVDKNYFVSE